MASEPQFRILIVKIGALGDVVVALPMLSALRAKHFNAHITWICGSRVAALIRFTKQVDRVIEIDEDSIFGSGFQKYSATAQLWRQVAMRRFDLILVAHRDSRYRWLVLPARGGERRSFNHDGRNPSPVPGRYRGDEHVRLATGVDRPGAARVPIPKMVPVLSQRLEQTLRGASRPLIAIAPGGARNLLRDQPLRRWPVSSYAVLARHLIQVGLGVVIIGAPSDEWTLPSFSGLGVVSLVGQTEVMDLVAVLGRCDVLVAHDSGPLHLAAVSGTKLVALFGPTNAMEVAPRFSGVRVLRGGLTMACSPCYDGLDYARCSNNFCLQEITVPQVVAGIAELLGRPDLAGVGEGRLNPPESKQF